MSRGGDIEFKWRKASFVRADSLAVEPDFSPAVNSVEQQLDSTATEAGWNLQVAPVAGGSGFAVETFHHPMGGNLDVFPAGVRKISQIEVWIRIGLKAPRAIEIDKGYRIIGHTEAWSQI